MKPSLKNFDTFQIIGFAVSTIISIGLLITGQDQIMSVILGFILAILTQLFDLQKRYNDSEERLLKANILSQDLYRNEWLLEHIQQIVSDYQTVKEIWFDLFRYNANDAVIQCHRVLHGMAEGFFNCPSNSHHVSDTLTKTKKTARAVAAIDDAYWRTPNADAYVKASADTIAQRKVEFIRIFTYPLITLYGMVDVLEKHQKSGIQVLIAPAESTPRELNEDYIILDGKVLFRTEQIGQQQRISIDKDEVNEAKRRFEALSHHAKKLDDVIDSLKNKEWKFEN